MAFGLIQKVDFSISWATVCTCTAIQTMKYLCSGGKETQNLSDYLPINELIAYIHQIFNPYIHLSTASVQLSSHKTPSHYLLLIHKSINVSSHPPLKHSTKQNSILPIANFIQSSAHPCLHLATHSTTNQSVNDPITSFPQLSICPSNHTLSSTNHYEGVLISR